jgi:hypothetical protein
VTHRFHPLYGREFEFVVYRQNWGEDRVHLRDENGVLFSLPAGWTDAAAADPFVVIADGRCPFTTGGLLAVADLVDRFRARQDGTGDVKAIMPWMLSRLRRHGLRSGAPAWPSPPLFQQYSQEISRNAGAPARLGCSCPAKLP